jgi:glucan biosynthesis protein C
MTVAVKQQVVSDFPISSTHTRLSDKPLPRLLFIDNLRWTMIILVVSMHAAVTYSGVGSWYYLEKTKLGRPTLFVFVSYQAFLQAFFMAFLFFIAGLFVPPAFDRKGIGLFLRDRAFRLGLPVVLYMFVIGPLTEYYVAESWRPALPSSFAIEWTNHIKDGEFLGGSGPLWFCLALLIFCVGYAIVRLSLRPAGSCPWPSHEAPGNVTLLSFIVLIAVCTFFVRLAQPSGTSFLNLQLANFSQYVLMFIGGIFAYRGDWLTRFPYRRGLRWLVLTLALGFTLWLTILIFGGAFEGNVKVYGGGWYWQSAAFDLWESFVCVGICTGLLVWYRAKLNNQGRLAKFLSDNAFCVYVFHPPIVIAAARLLHRSSAGPLTKFAALTIISVTLTFALSSIVLRRIPGLRQIL